MPSALNDLGGATAYPWYGYAALVTAATSAAPTVAQARFTEKPMHYGNICNSGLGCTTNLSADRQMADFFGFGLDRSGALQIVFDDTTNEFDGAGLEAVRQVGGQSALGGQVKSSVHRILRSLGRHGYIKQMSRGGLYRLGIEFLSLANSIRTGSSTHSLTRTRNCTASRPSIRR